MEIINRYIHTVTKHLPVIERQEVEKELLGSIMEMLPEDYTEDDVKKILYDLGNPVLLSEKYREHPRYLIGPNLYNSYLYVLKLVFIIVACVAPVAAFLLVLTGKESTVNVSPAIFIQILIQTISITIQGGFQVFGWVTLIFFVLDRTKVPMQWPFSGKEWTVEDLEEVPSDCTIHKSDPVFSIIFTMIITLALCFFSQFFGWYKKDGEVWSSTPLFDKTIIQGYIPFLLIIGVFGIIVAILKLIYQRWNRHLAIINAIYEFSSIIIAGIFILNPNLFNKTFLTVFASNVNVEIDRFMRMWQGGIWGTLVMIVLIGIWDIISGFIKLKRGTKL